MPDQVFDPAIHNLIEKGVAHLRDEFRGIFPHETSQRFVDEAITSLASARIKDFVPLLVNRFPSERLGAPPQVQGSIAKDVPEVLFVRVHNARRSQMAAGLLNHHANLRSANTAPTNEINPAAPAMAELGIELSEESPKPLTDELLNAADVVITMGCGHACPIYPGKRYGDLGVEDPAGKNLDEVTRTRDDIEARVLRLLASLVPADTRR